MKKLLLLGASGLVGQTLVDALRETYRIIPAAGRQTPEGGYRLPAEEPDRLLEVLEREDPEIVVSAIRGSYQAQTVFHERTAAWMAGKNKRLLYVSTANVFDGDLSRPWTEADPPCPESEYGVFKRDCEELLRKKLGDQLVIFRLAAVWSPDCPRIHALRTHSRNGELHHTYRGDAVNITLARQIGDYAKYVLDHDLRGVFHVGTTDMTDYFDFEKMVCDVLRIPLPEFETEEPEGQAYQAVLPARREIPDELQLTIAQVLAALG